MIIKLKNDEYQYLINASFMNERNLSRIFSEAIHNDSYVNINLSCENAEFIREQLEDRLQIAGFDDNYELNSEGIIIDALIDKFFVSSNKG